MRRVGRRKSCEKKKHCVNDGVPVRRSRTPLETTTEWVPHLRPLSTLSTHASPLAQRARSRDTHAVRFVRLRRKPRHAVHGNTWRARSGTRSAEKSATTDTVSCGALRRFRRVCLRLRLFPSPSSQPHPTSPWSYAIARSMRGSRRARGPRRNSADETNARNSRRAVVSSPLRSRSDRAASRGRRRREATRGTTRACGTRGARETGPRTSTLARTIVPRFSRRRLRNSSRGAATPSGASSTFGRGSQFASRFPRPSSPLCPPLRSYGRRARTRGCLASTRRVLSRPASRATGPRRQCARLRPTAGSEGSHPRDDLPHRADAKGVRLFPFMTIHKKATTTSPRQRLPINTRPRLRRHTRGRSPAALSGDSTGHGLHSPQGRGRGSDDARPPTLTPGTKNGNLDDLADVLSSVKLRLGHPRRERAGPRRGPRGPPERRAPPPLAQLPGGAQRPHCLVARERGVAGASLAAQGRLRIRAAVRRRDEGSAHLHVRQPGERRRDVAATPPSSEPPSSSSPRFRPRKDTKARRPRRVADRGAPYKRVAFQNNAATITAASIRAGTTAVASSTVRAAAGTGPCSPPRASRALPGGDEAALGASSHGVNRGCVGAGVVHRLRGASAASSGLRPSGTRRRRRGWGLQLPFSLRPLGAEATARCSASGEAQLDTRRRRARRGSARARHSETKLSAQRVRDVPASASRLGRPRARGKKAQLRPRTPERGVRRRSWRIVSDGGGDDGALFKDAEVDALADALARGRDPLDVTPRGARRRALALGVPKDGLTQKTVGLCTTRTSWKTRVRRFTSSARRGTPRRWSGSSAEGGSLGAFLSRRQRPAAEVPSSCSCTARRTWTPFGQPSTPPPTARRLKARATSADEAHGEMRARRRWIGRRRSTTVASGALHRAFAVVRPPGHHAECARAMGFCFFNNTVIAARAALTAYPERIKKILLVDFAAVRTTGTAYRIFRTTTTPSCTSSAPTTGGFYRKRGRCRGNRLPGRDAGRAKRPVAEKGVRRGGERRVRFDVVPHREAPRPIRVVVAARRRGEGDPLGGMRVSDQGFALMTERLQALAGGRIVCALEGLLPHRHRQRGGGDSRRDARVRRRRRCWVRRQPRRSTVERRRSMCEGDLAECWPVLRSPAHLELLREAARGTTPGEHGAKERADEKRALLEKLSYTIGRRCSSKPSARPGFSRYGAATPTRRRRGADVATRRCFVKSS